ncbi:MAG: hypothetical protein HXY24_15475 [Rubrivivax sp.]|nr:hypothetical protein [Rubrivivax sp.]
MAVSKTMWLKGLREDLAKWKRAAAIDRSERVKEITRKWREGFAALKAENDRLQRENEEQYHNDIVAAETHFREAVEMGPPKD